ncbi:hypothetical protein ES708_04150 [subsurface metagenome]
MKILYHIVIASAAFCLTPFAGVSAQQPDLTLPVYSIQISTEDIESLNVNPWAKEYFDAVFSFGDETIPCEVRYRGATSLKCPKKSWRIKFDDSDNIFNVRKINLNAEYRDKSFMRNFISCRIFQYFGYPAPDTDFISLYINDDYAGVFIQIEEVDEFFLERNGRKSGNLYKGENHGASMAPLTQYWSYAVSWDKQIGDSDDFSDIQLLFNKLFYWTKEDFDRNITNEVLVDNILNYFAMMFTIVSGDNYTKNLILYSNPESGLFEIIPWDNDAAYGNDWEGNYFDSFAEIYDGTILNNQLLFQRLMEVEEYKAEFWEKVEAISTSGFSYLHNLVNETYSLIKNDVYQDSEKGAENSEFDAAISQLHSFLDNRTEFLKGRDYFNRIHLSDFYCSNPFPTADNPSVSFRVKSSEKQVVSLIYVVGLDFRTPGSSYVKKRITLFDDGLHDDFSAGDLIYGNSLTIPNGFTGIIPYCFVGNGYDTPYNGFFYISHIRTNTLALNCINSDSDAAHNVKIGEIYNLNSEMYVELKNTSSVDVDISYCHLRGNEYYLDFIIREFTVLGPYESIIIASNKQYAANAFEDVRTIGNIYFDIAPGDSVQFLSPTRSLLDAAYLDEYSSFEDPDYSVVINEINYNSSDEFNPGDWVELYNSGDAPVDVSGWIFRDDNESHSFVIPDDVIINPYSYIVLCRDVEAFVLFFPNVDNYYGDFDFGLNGDGEYICLLTDYGTIADSLTYDDDPPWTVEADGTGHTLSLINPLQDNALPVSWLPSLMYGTPGEINDVFVGVDNSGQYVHPVSFSLGRNYPNPFNPVTTIPLYIPVTSRVTIEIYTILGQKTGVILDEMLPRGQYSVKYDASDLPSGLYLYHMSAGSFYDTGKMMLMK